MKQIAIGVREFAVPCPRTGSIEANSGLGLTDNKGTLLHSQVQRQRKAASANYRAEVRVNHSFETSGYCFLVSGRIDGLFEGDNPHIEEIKSTFNLGDLLDRLAADPCHPYSLQLKTYAYIYYRQNNIVPATSFHIISSRNGQSEDVCISLALSDYESWLSRRLDELVSEEKIREADEDRRIQMAKQISFPFPRPRQGQIDLIQSIENQLSASSRLLIQAPTGLGKTMGVMYPMLKEALGRGQRIIYVTPKNSQHAVAEEAIKKFQQKKVGVKALTLTAKSKICFLAEPICNPDHCLWAKDYYQKVHEHDLTGKLAKHKNLTARKFRQYGQKYKVCPFELSVDALARADVIIADYNYVFSPRNSLLGRLSSVVNTAERPNLIIDEVHNLPGRAADYYSPALSSSCLRQLTERIRRLPAPFSAQGEAMLNQCLGIIESCKPEGTAGDAQIEIPQAAFLSQDDRLKDFLGRYLQSNLPIEAGDPIMRLCWQWSDFTQALSSEGEEFFTTFRRQHGGGTIKVTCCDASAMLSGQLDLFQQVVGFSATLKPFDYYARLSGFDLETVVTKEFPSPFPRSNRKLLVIPQVSTRYSDRSLNYQKISEAIRRIVCLKSGNYFVFFPSFEFLQRVADLTEVPGSRILLQKPQMKQTEVNACLDHLKLGEEPTVIFAVQGGVFSEGVDYPGNMIIGAIIVGPALPGYDIERELLRSYYEKHYGSGFDWAYTYPSMAKVVQSAGRVIRSEEERGLIVLMDQRFTKSNYVKSMPADWFDSSVQELVSTSIIQDVSEFWAREDFLP